MKLTLWILTLFVFNYANGDCSLGHTDDAISIRITRDSLLPYDAGTSGFAHITFYNAVLGNLLRLKGNLAVEPDLLEKAYWDYKKKAYILTLPAEIYFHNGRKVSIEDLYFSLVRFFYTEARKDQVAFLNHMDGVKGIGNSPYKDWSVPGIWRIDSRSLAIKLSEPNPSFLYSLANGWISLVPREELEDDFVSWKTVPVGAGPYKVQSIRGSNVSICRRRTGPGPRLVTFVSDPQSLADVTGFGQDSSGKSIRKVFGQGPIGFTGVFFNANNELASDLDFRKFVWSVLKEIDFADGSSSRKNLSQVLTSNFYGRLDPSPATQIQESETRAFAKKFESLVINAHWYTGSTRLIGDEKKIADKVMGALSKYGIRVKFNRGSHPTFSPEDSSTVFRLDRRGTAFPDPLVIFKAFDEGGFLSPFMPKNLAGEHRVLVSDAAMSSSLDVKAVAIERLSKFYLDNVVVIPLFESKSQFFINSKKISDLGLQTNITLSFDRIRLAK